MRFTLGFLPAFSINFPNEVWVVRYSNFAVGLSGVRASAVQMKVATTLGIFFFQMLFKTIEGIVVGF